jgi:hypothetical protein
MKYRAALLLSLLLLAAGCNRRNDEQSLFYSDGRSKPVVALVPVIDSSDHDLSWSLSDEFTSTIQDRLLQREMLFLIDNKRVQAITQTLKEENNPFGTDLNWIKTAFPKQEFVVFMELIEHRETAAVVFSESPVELNMSMRLRIFDLRGTTPKVVLQELIHESEYLSMGFTHNNFFQVPWGRESFSITPLGLAHAKLIKEVSGRIEDYILIAKSN